MAGTPPKRRTPPKSSKREGKKRQPLRREEWDFESVKEVDLPACYLWEYWREKCLRDPSIANALKNFRHAVQSQDEEIRQHDQKQLSLYRLILAKSPDLPEEHAESLKFYGKFNLYLWSTANPLTTEMDGLANISEEYFPRRAFQSLESVLKQMIRGEVTPRSHKGQLPPLAEIPTPHEGEPNQQLHLVESISLQLNWNHTNESIQEAFREWLLLSRGSRKATLSRGLGPGKSVTKTLLKDLKSLGALRLLTHHGSSSAAFTASEKAKGAMYVEKSEWSDAKTHAENLLQGFNLLPD